MSRRVIGPATALALLLALGGCASDPVVEAAPTAPAGAALAVAIADAVPPARLSAVIADFDAALKAKLALLPLSSAYRLVGGDGAPVRLLLDADRAFEVGNAQMKPELLLPLADVADVGRATGAWVIHVIGTASTSDEAELAERRAASVLAYLASRGFSAGRLRSETRSGRGHGVDLQFVPIVEGREAQAWMSPAALGARR